MNMKSALPTLGVMTAALLAGQFPGEVRAAPYVMPDIPLIVSVDSVPNVWFQLDDSGSIDVGVLAGEHFSSCAYNPVLQCNDGTVPLEGGMRVWGGRWGDNNATPELTNITDVLYSPASVKGNDCYENGTYNTVSECVDDYGIEGDRSHFNDGIRGDVDFDIDRDWRLRSANLNVLFFDPNAEYTPWTTFDGTFPDAAFNNARYWPVENEAGYNDTVDLGNEAAPSNGPFYYNYWIDDRGYDGTAPDANPLNMTVGSNGVVDQWDSYIKVTVTNSSVSCEKVTHDPQPFDWPDDREGINPSVGPATTAECTEATAGKSATQLRQDIANWYQYYQKRVHVERGAVGSVVVELPNLRYGMGTINGNGRFYIPDAAIDDYAAHGESLLDNLYGYNRQNLGTPLRTGLEWVGNMYADDVNGVDSPIIESCQKNFSLLFSDGYWNGGSPDSRFADVDGDGESISGSNRLLADVAAYFYREDLRDDLDDAVPTDSFDSANWQHMVTYTIAFGITGALTEDAGDKPGWPFPAPVDDGNWYPGGVYQLDVVDDMWHAAWNARGRFFSATRPEDLYNDVRESLTDIASRIGGAASAAANSGSISSTSRIFQAKFDTADWHGELLAFPVNDDGTLGSTAIWNANALLNAKSNSELASNAGGRDVWTWNNEGSPGGTAFEWSSISAEQQALLNTSAQGGSDDLGQQRLRYVRGDSSNEAGQGGSFRSRDNKLGDIVNSDPVFIGFPPFFYPFGGYQTFFNDHKARTGVIYVGANDGMLHAFRESDGEELFAYVPDEVIEHLPALVEPDYGHRFYVDSPPAYGDVQVGGNWISLLAGTLRSGGQGVYALDVTDPENFGASDVLWEFTDEVDADLGYTFGQAQVKRMANDKWAVIVGNGINNTEADGNASTTGAGALFVLFIENGADGWQTGDYVKLTVPGGSVDDPNALFTPAAADVDGDFRVDFIYAGDRNGKMWKFDVSDASPANWGLAFNEEPLFDAGAGHPITDRPAVAAHPAGRRLGQLVIFGTGQFIETGDNAAAGQPEQSLYAIWDFDEDWATEKEVPAADLHGNTRDELASATFTVDDGVRVMSGGADTSWLDGDGDPDDLGWYVDLPVTGERIVRRPVLRDNLVFFVTLIPSELSCSAGGTGWVMAMDFSTGQAATFPVFDIGGDLDITVDGDLVEAGDPDDTSDDLVPVGIESPSIPNLPALIYDDRPGFSSTPSQFPPAPNQARGCDAGNARAYTFTTGSNGSIMAVETATEALSCGRQSWRRKR